MEMLGRHRPLHQRGPWATMKRYIYKSILLHTSITILDASANIKENLLIQQSQQKHFTEEEEEQQQQTTTAQQVQLELETKPNKQR